MRKIENRIGNIENSNSNQIIQTTIHNQTNNIYVSPNLDQFWEVRASHQLFPYYMVDYKKNKNGKYFLYSKPLKEDAEKLYPINYKTTFSVVDERYKNIKDSRLLFDMIQYADTPVEIKIHDFKRYLGKIEDPYPDENDELLSSKNAVKSYIMPSERKLPNAKVNIDFNFIDSINSIKNISLKLTKQISSKHIILDNYHQKKSDIQFRFDFDFNKKDSNCKMTYSINEEKRYNCKAKLKYNKFCLDLYTKKHSIVDRKTNRVILSGENNKEVDQETINSIKRYISILEKISTIEDFFGIEFNVPDSIEKKDVIEINELYQYIINSKHKTKSEELTCSIMKKETDKEKINDFISLHKMCLVSTTNSVVYEILGKEIQISELKQTYENIKCSNEKEIQELLNRFDELPDDYIIEIKMKSVTGKFIYGKTEITK